MSLENTTGQELKNIMRITAEFVTSVAQVEQLPPESIPEIALVGRSNVGKSSLINALVGKNGLARTSNTPGRTQTLNYYLVTIDNKKSFHLVDMPGYGFAAVNLNSRAKWKNLNEHYLNTRPNLCGVMQIIDLRHPPQPLDHTMSAWLDGIKQNYVIIGTKADKIAKTKVNGALKEAVKSLKLDADNSIAFSAETKLGRDEVLNWVVNSANGIK